MEVARRIELSRNRAAAAARAMFPQSRHPVSRRRWWDLVPRGSPRSPIPPCPAPSYWMSRRADGRRAVKSRLSRGWGDPCFARLLACLRSQCGRVIPGLGAKRELAFLLRFPGTLWHRWGGAAWKSKLWPGPSQPPLGRVTPGLRAPTVHSGGRLAYEPPEKLGPPEELLSPK